MVAQRDLFIDIDREPERPGARPPGVSGVDWGTSSPLWPALSSSPARRDPREVGASPLGSVPVEPSRGGNSAFPSHPAHSAGVPTRPLASDLASSMASLRPPSSATRPLSLAEALAAMSGMPAAPLVAGQPSLAAVQPPDLDAGPGRRSPDGVYRVTVPLQEARFAFPASAPEEGDDYLERSYDFVRPEVAELYGRVVVPLWSAPFGRMLLSAFQACPRQPGWQVADIACGTGYPTLEVAQLLGRDGDVAGVDVWSAGIVRAQARAEALRLQNVTFLVTDVADCDLPEQSFDVALCNLGLANFARPEAALKGMARLLQPNGTLILTTHLQGAMQEFFETYCAVLNDLGLVGLSWDVEQMMQAQPTLESTEALLDLAGFTVDQTINDHFALEFPNGSTFLRSPLVGLSFLQDWRPVIKDLALRRAIFHEIERRLNTRAAAWGRLDLIVPMLCLTARRRAGYPL